MTRLTHREHVARLLGVDVDDLPTPGDIAHDQLLDQQNNRFRPPPRRTGASGEDPWWDRSKDTA